MVIRLWYIIVRRIGRPPQVLHTFGNYADAALDVNDLRFLPGVHSVSLLAEEDRFGSAPAGEHNEVF